MQCRDFRELASTFLDDELLVETNHEIIRHLEACADCRRELAARQNMRAVLCAAIERAPHLKMRDEFTEQLQAQLRAELSRRMFR